jgi:spore coat protein U-like protein
VCSVAAATLNFPDYNPVTGAAVDGSANVSVTCTKGTPFKLVLDSDAGEMKPASGPSRLAYTLHSDASRTTAFPTAVAAQSNVTATGTAPDSVAIFGRVTASQNTVEAGLHSDTVAMTVHY